MDVQHLAGEKRFTVAVEGGEGMLAYESPRAGVIDLQHTVVPEAARERGVGAALVAAAVSHARAQELRIIPTCPFVKHWLEQHPEAADLVAR